MYCDAAMLTVSATARPTLDRITTPSSTENAPKSTFSFSDHDALQTLPPPKYTPETTLTERSLCDATALVACYPPSIQRRVQTSPVRRILTFGVFMVSVRRPSNLWRVCLNVAGLALACGWAR